MSLSSSRTRGKSRGVGRSEILPGLTGRSDSSRTVWNAVALQQSLAAKLSMPGETPTHIGYQRTTKTGQTKKRLKEMSVQKSKSGQKIEEERVIGQQRQPLTLAQKLGLSDAPPEPLSEADWDKIKVMSATRGDSHQPCAICHDSFDHLRHQVLLSCSHTFHKACLNAFERLSSSKCCPMCRRHDYEKRLVFDGARSYRSRAAARIQAAWRGHCVRRWYKDILRTMAAPSDPWLRKRHFQRCLTDIADSWTANCDKKARNVEELLVDVDQALDKSRQITAHASSFLAGHKERDPLANKTAWEKALTAAKDRKDRDCPICMTSLMKSCAVLLSCSHVFHKQCVVTMEDFACGRLPCCPVCRAAYIRRDWPVA